MLEEQQGPQFVKQRHVKTLTDMGFVEKEARRALAAAGDSLEKALEQLQVL
jgi:Holliday junction resolvasome RuvABC DNA-binding subunit